MSLSHPSPQAAVPARSALAYNLAGIALLTLLAAVGAAYLVDRAGRTGLPPPPALDDGNTISQTINGVELAIPSTWFRNGAQMRPGFATQVDLRFQLDLVEAGPPETVDVTLLPRSRARASSALLDAVYLHQFAEGTVGGIPGLVGKPLLPRDGYQSETVWYDALSPNPFVAKCMAAVEPDLPDRCLRTVHLANGLAAIVSFDATALDAWARFDAEMGLWLARIGAL